MDYNATISREENDSLTCDRCGAKFSVFYKVQPGHNEKEEYKCPECKKVFSVIASEPIFSQSVKLIKPRTDGEPKKM